MQKVQILAIETSCDETSLALVEVEDGDPEAHRGIEVSGGLRTLKFKVLKNLIASQIATHRPFGGVVPNIAKREHLTNLPILYKKLLTSHYSLVTSLDLIAVTVGPGLEPALWTGIEFAKQLGKKLGVSVVGANHLEGHLYSFLLTTHYSLLTRQKFFPAIALLVSGGHTILLLLKSLTNRKKLGETRDDAVGEAFDKVARILGLPYPGGPEIEKLAKRGKPDAINFPRPMLHQKNYDFSFSGLKTAVLYYLRDVSSNLRPPAYAKASAGKQNLRANIAASFQAAAIDVLVQKTIRAAREYGAKSILLSGGVAANKALRKKLEVLSNQSKVNFIAPPMKFNTDNAAMIAVAGYMSYLQKKKRKLVAHGDLNF